MVKIKTVADTRGKVRYQALTKKLSARLAYVEFNIVKHTVV